MKGKTLLSLAIAFSVILAVMPLALVKAAPPVRVEVIFPNGLSTYEAPYGSTFQVAIKIFDTPDITQYIIENIYFKSDVLEVVPPPTDGGFIKSPVFLSKPVVVVNATYSKIPEITSASLTLIKSNGNGVLCYITFHAIGFGTSDITISAGTVYLLNVDVIVPVDIIVNGAAMVPTPPATPPKAIFTPADGTFFMVSTDVPLDGTASTAGIDTLPAVHGCPITAYLWEIDKGNDGTIDLTLTGSTNSFHCDGPGSVGITLTVTAPDNAPPTAPDYVDHASAKHVIMQIVPPVGVDIDVYTEKGGIGPGGAYPFGWSDAFGPQEEVTVYAKVTYNDEPVEYKPVAFEMIDANGESHDYRTAYTGADGIATTSFRIPWEGSAAEDLFGDWAIVGSVSVSEQQDMDTCYFKFGYIVSIRDIIVTGSPLKKGEFMTIDVDLESISMAAKDVILTIVACDECGVPIGLAAGAFTVLPEDGVAAGYTITIPSWAFVGTGFIYANVFTDYPSLGGVPYCPEDSAVFIINKT